MPVATFLLLFALAPSPQELDVDNVVILLDASGSMEKSMDGPGKMQKMIAAKRAIGEVLRRVSQETHVGLLVFSGRNKSDDWVYPLGPRDDAKLIAALERITPDGGTPLGAYMKTAADRLLEQRAEQSGYGTYRMLVVTDGQADDNDAPFLDLYLPDILARGVVVDVIGVAMDEDHVLAERVHSYRRADDLPALQQSIAEVFAEVGSDDGSTAGAEGFELAACLPDDAIASILAALTSSEDAPIGTLPAAGARVADEPGPIDWSQPAAPGTTQSPRSRSGSRTALVISLSVVAFIVLTRAMARARSRR